MNHPARFGRFLAVGFVSTAAHYLTLWLLVEHAGLNPAPASAVGFVVGLVVNYPLNHRYTFAAAGQRLHARAMQRFAVVVAFGLALNTALMALLTTVWLWPYLAAQVVTTAVCLVVNFLLHGRYSFARPERAT